MLKSASPLSQSTLTSRLQDQSMLRPGGGGRGKRSMVAGLLLTSLVDAFSILVIFLIMNHAASQDVVNTGQKIVLPQAMDSQFIQNGIVVRIEDGKFMVEDQEVGLGQLNAELKRLNDGADETKRGGLVIVADRGLDYADLSPVILAGSQAGFTKFKFAVVRKD
jgi:biopolymer transport protein ExbD